MAAPKTAGLPKARLEEIQAALQDQSLTAQGFLERAFTFPEVESVDIFRLAPKPSGKLDAFAPGFSPEAVDDHMIEHHGAGRYSFRSRIQGQWIGAHAFAFGEFSSENGNHSAPVTRTTTPVDELDSKQLTKEWLEEMQREVQIGTLSDRKADQEQARINRQLFPIMMMAQMKKMFAEAAPAPPVADNGMLKLLERMLEQGDKRLELLERKLDALAKTPATAGTTTTADAIATVKSITDAAALLGFSRPDGAAGPPQPDMWDGISKVVSAPAVDRALGVLEQAIVNRVGSNGAKSEAGGPAVAQNNSNNNSNLNLDERTKTAIALGLEALRSRDFPTLFDVLTIDLRISINPEVNPLVYVNRFRPFIPEIDTLRAELAEFLKWLGGKVAEEKAARMVDQAVDGEDDD